MKRDSRLNALLRCLRVAFSVVCGGLCVFVIGFWVRSYFYFDGGVLKILPSEYIQIHAGAGRMCIWFEHKPIDKWFDWWSSRSNARTPGDADDRIPVFALNFWPTFARLYAAHWLFAVITGFLAVVPWCPRKFDIRALMIAVTVVAAITAVITWVDKTF